MAPVLAARREPTNASRYANRTLSLLARQTGRFRWLETDNSALLAIVVKPSRQPSPMRCVRVFRSNVFHLFHFYLGGKRIQLLQRPPLTSTMKERETIEL